MTGNPFYLNSFFRIIRFIIALPFFKIEKWYY
jgi:hypothetical protein